MDQVIRTDNNPDTTGTNAILIVLLLAAIVAFAVWFFGQGAVPVEDDGLNVDVNLPAGTPGGTDTGNTGGGNPGGQ